MKQKGRRLALAASALGLVVLALTAVAFRDAFTQAKATFGRTGGVLDPFLIPWEDGGMKAKGREIAVMTASVGVLTLAFAAFFARKRIAEEYWLWRLSRVSSDEAKVKAIDKLGDLHSMRAVPIIMDTLNRMASRGVLLQSKLVTDAAFRSLDAIGELGEQESEKDILLVLFELEWELQEYKYGRIPPRW